MAEHPLIVMRGIVKKYPGVTALRDVSLSVEASEVMAVVGENGAGKSTLLKILAGAERADEGIIEVSGRVVQIQSPRESQARGIAVIYQELNLANDLSVAENIYAGREPKTRWGTVDFRTMERGASKLLNDLGINVSPDEIVGNLNIALRQMVDMWRKQRN